MGDMDPQNEDSFIGRERKSSDEEPSTKVVVGKDFVPIEPKLVSYDGRYEVVDNKSDELEKNYSILKLEEVTKLQDDDIALVSTVLCVSKSDACLLLLHSNWRTIDLADAWFEDEHKIRAKTGLLEKPLLDNAGENQSSSCRLCSDSNNSKFSASCGHPFCGDCWRFYMRKSINDEGSACLILRCPEPNCSAAVCPDLVQNVMLATDQETECYKRYKHYFLRSYFKDQKLVKWCPVPDCNSAIWLDNDGGSSTTCYYVSCVCSRGFCWNCEVEENHHPVDCETAKKWTLENSYENSIPNRKEVDCESAYSVADYKRAKNIGRFVDCYQLWKKYGKLKEEALRVYDELKGRHGTSVLLLEACKLMIECRQVLRWTPVYGYYNMSDDNGQHPKQYLHEILQGLVESSVDRLESQVKSFLVSESDFSSSSAAESMEFALLMQKTKTYLGDLVRGLEQGFPELCLKGANWTCQRCTCINPMSAVNCEMCTAETKEGESTRYWACDRCTFLNPASTTTCSLCSESWDSIESRDSIDSWDSR